MGDSKRDKKLDGENLNQVIINSLKKSNEEKLFNFTLNLCGASLLGPVETLISSRYNAAQPDADPLFEDFKDPKKYLEASIPDCGSFSKGFFEFLTKEESKINEQAKFKNTSELQTLVREKKDIPYIIQLSVPGHQYSILVTDNKDGKPQGYVYQTNTAGDMKGEKFSIQDWVSNKKNTAIDVLGHLEKIDVLLDSKQNLERRKKTYEELYTIPASDEVKTTKDLDKLVTIPEEKSLIQWEVGNITNDAQKRLSILYKESAEELRKLKHFFGISPQADFVTTFSEKLESKQIALEEEPELKEKLEKLSAIGAEIESELIRRSVFKEGRPVHELSKKEQDLLHSQRHLHGDETASPKKKG